MSALLFMPSAEAQTFQPSGASGDWFTTSNWSPAALPTSSTTNAAIQDGKTAVIGGTGAAAGTLYLMGTSGLTIQNGGTATIGNLNTGAFSITASSTILIDGVGSQLTTTGTDSLGFSGGTTVFTVQNGGAYSAATVQLGYNTGSQASLTVTGSGSQFTTSGTFEIGYFGFATFTLSDGATATNATVHIASAAFSGAGTSGGTAIITGAGTTWNVGSGIGVGAYSSSSYYSAGSLTVADGATVNAVGQTVSVARTGTVQIGTGGLAGTLNAAKVAFSDQFSGTGTLAFNHTDNITFSASISGYGQVTKAGVGTVTFTGANTYYGGTVISAGTIRAGANNAIGGSTGSLTLAGGTFDLNGFNQQISTLNVTADSTLNFSGASILYIYNASSGNPWTGTLTLTNFTIGTNKIYVGSSVGFTSSQLSQIELAGYTASIDGSGYVIFSAIPEPATTAALAAACVLGLAAWHRRRRQTP